MGKSSRKKKKASEEIAACKCTSESSGKSYLSDTRLLKRPLTHTTQDFKYYLAASVAFITFLVYLLSLRNDFVNWDDGLYVYDNPNIRFLNPAFFRWAFFDFYAANWHPLTWISHALDYAFWGLNPLGPHLTSNILHAVNTFIVVVLVTRLLEGWKSSTTANGPAVFLNGHSILIAAGATGLLFGLHPVHVESVAWVAERKDLLCALFFLLSIISYTKYVSGINTETIHNAKSRFLNKQYLFSTGFFILALLSKPMAVTLPAVLLILDWYPFNRIRSMKLFLSAFAEKIPFIVSSLVSSILTVLAQKAGGAIRTLEVIPLSSRVFVAAESLVSYLWKMALPVNLIPYYPYPKNLSLFSKEYVLSIILVFGITAACLVVAKKQKLLLSVWGYYVLTLMPVLGIVQVGDQSMADRYTYLPGIGPFLIMGLLAACVWGKISAPQRWATHVKFFCVTAAILVVVSLSLLTLKQILIWKNSVTLWTYVIKKELEPVSFTYNNLGNAYRDRNMPDKAIEHHMIAIKLNPGYAEAHNNLGVAYGSLNMPDKAIEQFLIAIKLKPDYAEAHYNLGSIYGDHNMVDQAIEQYLIAIKLKPDYTDAHYNLGIIYGDHNMVDQAIEQYLIAIKLKPDYAKAHNNLGVVYHARNMVDQAIEQYLIATRLKPDFAEAHYNLGVIYYKIGEMEKVRTELMTALKIKPDYQRAQQLLNKISH